MKAVATLFGALIAVALVAAFGLGLFGSIAWLVGYIASLDPDILFATGVLVATGFAAAVYLAGGNKRTAQHEMAAQVQAEKATAYGLMIDVWRRLIIHGPRSSEDVPDKIRQAMDSVRLRLALYGSAEVMKSHVKLKRLLENGEIQTEDGRSSLAMAVCCIRKELGTGCADSHLEDVAQILFPSDESDSSHTEARADSPVPIGRGSADSEALADL